MSEKQVLTRHDGITATRSGVLSPGILAFCPRFHENRFVGRNSAVLSLRAEGQRVEEPKGPRVKASQAGVRGDKMRWVLSIMSWSAMQVRSRQLAADRGAVTVLGEASGWYLSRVAKERNPGAPGRSGLRDVIIHMYSTRSI